MSMCVLLSALCAQMGKIKQALSGRERDWACRDAGNTSRSVSQSFPGRGKRKTQVAVVETGVTASGWDPCCFWIRADGPTGKRAKVRSNLPYTEYCVP